MITLTQKKTSKIPGNTSFFVDFKYDKEIIDIIKKLHVANFDKKTSLWEIPLTSLATFVNLAIIRDDIEIHLLEDKKQAEIPAEIKLPKFKTKPFDYQLDGIKYGLTHDAWLLLDEPGLGKTLQILYIAQELKKREKLKHCFIICGVNTLKTNWEKEILKHTNLDCRILGKKVTRTGNVTFGSVQDRADELLKPIKEFFVITNIETLRDERIMKALKKNVNEFDMVVIDEVHCIKNPNAQQSKNLLKFNSAKYKIALTGTLLLNNPLDAYIPLKWIKKERSTYSNYRYYYCNYGGLFGTDFLGYRNIPTLQQQLSECSLRRKKDLLDLPEKTVVKEYVDMGDVQQKFYNNIKNGIKDQVDKVKLSAANTLAMVARLRQATALPSILTTENISSAKVDRCCDLVEQIVSSGNKVVIFSTYKDTANELMNKLSTYKPLLATGDVKDDIISKNIDKFQNSDENKVFIATWQKCGTGITLTRASYAIFIDTPWTAGVLEQCEDRVHRIGSKEPVFIYHLITKDTIDERVNEIVEDKGIISDYVLDNEVSPQLFERLKSIIQDL